MAWQGLITLQNFVKQGGVFVAATNSTDLALSYGLTRGVVTNPIPASTTVKDSLLRTRLADATSPIAYGVADNLAVFSNDGQSFTGPPAHLRRRRRVRPRASGWLTPGHHVDLGAFRGGDLRRDVARSTRIRTGRSSAWRQLARAARGIM